MLDPLSISAIVISSITVVGTIVVAILQILKGGWDCSGSSCLSSDCCSKELTYMITTLKKFMSKNNLNK